MTRLLLLEPDDADGRWQPFRGVRPVAELRAGAWRIRERWEHAVGVRAEAIVSRSTAGFTDVDTPPVVTPGSVRGPALLAASDFIPEVSPLPMPDGVTRLVAHGRTVARILAPGESARELDDAGHSRDISGRWLRGTFDLLEALDGPLQADCAAVTATVALPAQSLVLGDPGQVRVASDGVEPGVVFDVRHGAIAILPGAEVRSGTRLEGPCWIGEGARIVGGFLRQSVIGPRCVVRGEVSNTVFLGYANKAHDGFVGHSVVGHWANLGALTTTSNLKNTYGAVRLDPPEGPIETGRQFLGSLIGDHAKVAIGTMFATGSIVGAGANVFGDHRPPRWLRPFAWGSDGQQQTTETGFLATARRVMPRRDVTVTPAHEAWLTALYRTLA
jgi:UDP-N-acetylglucosamine diphosphorylase/glucosamine-1-phosphate N-acetyltransferase